MSAMGVATAQQLVSAGHVVDVVHECDVTARYSLVPSQLRGAEAQSGTGSSSAIGTRDVMLQVHGLKSHLPPRQLFTFCTNASVSMGRLGQRLQKLSSKYLDVSTRATDEVTTDVPTAAESPDAFLPPGAQALSDFLPFVLEGSPALDPAYLQIKLEDAMMLATAADQTASTSSRDRRLFESELRARYEQLVKSAARRSPPATAAATMHRSRTGGQSD